SHTRSRQDSPLHGGDDLLSVGSLFGYRSVSQFAVEFANRFVDDPCFDFVDHVATNFVRHSFLTSLRCKSASLTPVQHLLRSLRVCCWLARTASRLHCTSAVRSRSFTSCPLSMLVCVRDIRRRCLLLHVHLMPRIPPKPARQLAREIIRSVCPRLNIQ